MVVSSPPSDEGVGSPSYLVVGEYLGLLHINGVILIFLAKRSSGLPHSYASFRFLRFDPHGFPIKVNEENFPIYHFLGLLLNSLLLLLGRLHTLALTGLRCSGVLSRF